MENALKASTKELDDVKNYLRQLESSKQMAVIELHKFQAGVAASPPHLPRFRLSALHFLRVCYAQDRIAHDREDRERKLKVRHCWAPPALH